MHPPKLIQKIKPDKHVNKVFEPESFDKWQYTGKIICFYNVIQFSGR